jgi:hypothetical protein
MLSGVVAHSTDVSAPLIRFVRLRSKVLALALSHASFPFAFSADPILPPQHLGLRVLVPLDNNCRYVLLVSLALSVAVSE